MTTENQKPAETNRVTYIAYTVEKSGKETYWTRVGVAFKSHKDGEGFTAKFAYGIAVSGEIVFRKPKPEEVEVQPAAGDEEVPF